MIVGDQQIESTDGMNLNGKVHEQHDPEHEAAVNAFLEQEAAERLYSTHNNGMDLNEVIEVAREEHNENVVKLVVGMAMTEIMEEELINV